MIPAPINANESERLEALRRYRILDTPDTAEFDDFTRLASALCATPIALISLLDADRQWFKSKVGLDAEQTPRDISFCGHAIHGNDIFEVSNALQDERFRDNPLVTGAPAIRFYAGAPLLTPEGYGIGTLCVIDTVPHTLTQIQRDTLKVLSRLLVQQLELGLAVRKEQALNDELASRATFSKALLDGAGMAIISTTIEGVITSFNPGAEALLGYSSADLVGRATPAVFHDAAEVIARAEQLSGELEREISPGFEVFVHKARSGAPETRDWTYCRKDGSRVAVELTVSAMRDASGKLMGYLGLARDISERKLAEKLKAEFVSVVSHELRTPLTSINGALGLIGGGVLGEIPPQAQQMIAIAHKNSQRLSALINDLLDMEGLEAGKLRFDMQVQPLMPLVDQAIESVRNYGEQYQVRFESIAREEAAEVRVDGSRLQQILTNFLSNAAKFSPPGSRVDIAVRRAGERVRVEVIDRGSGIPDDFRQHIFGKFSQADAADTRQKGGTGLGLAISKGFIEQMGGWIGFESELGRGSCFHVELPFLETGSTYTVSENPGDSRT